MSRLEELIEELCPNGVEYRNLGELGSFYGGLTGKKKDDFIDGNSKFISYTNVFLNLAVNTEINDLVKINEGENQRAVENGDIIFTGSSETPNECGMSSVFINDTNEPYYLNSFCFIFRLFDKNLLLPHFSKYLFRSDEIRKQINKTASGVTRFNVSKKKMEKVKIPLPPLPIQQEIVYILDSFTELTTKLTSELTSELEARRKQYEYYRRELLTFGDDVPKMRIGDICELKSGGDVPKEHWSKEKTAKYNVPIFSNGVNNDGLYGYTHIPRVLKPCVTIAGRGAGCGNVILRNEPFLPIIRLISAVPNDNVDVLYLYYCIQMIDFKIPKSGIPQLTVPMVSDYTIPVIDINQQKRIVTILEKFNNAYNNISTEIKKEIEFRQKQYDYYRDKLLTFKEKN